jgi:hypothetical protein
MQRQILIMIRNTLSVLLFLFGQLPLFAQLGEDNLMPEIEIGFKTIATGNFYSNQGAASLELPVLNEGEQVISDFSDSYFLIGARQKLYGNWRGQMALGLSFPDAGSGLGQVFYNQVFIQIENHKNIFKVGRSTSQTTLLEFPTLRDDDALQYNYVLNPFSDGLNTEDNQYANVLEFTHIFGQRWRVAIHGENFQDFENPNDFSLNGIGGSLVYRMPETQIWNRGFLQEIGLSYNNFLTGRPEENVDEVLTNFIGSVALNLKPDPVHFIDFKAQAIQNFGFDDIQEITGYSDYTRTKSTGLYGSFRYVYRKLERPTFMVSLGFGYKDFSNLGNSTNQWMGIASFFYRIGNNFDLVAQYRYSQNNGDLIPLLGENQHRFQVGLAYTFNKVFNSQFDDRNSILNLEHGYLK